MFVLEFRTQTNICVFYRQCFKGSASKVGPLTFQNVTTPLAKKSCVCWQCIQHTQTKDIMIALDVVYANFIKQLWPQIHGIHFKVKTSYETFHGDWCTANISISNITISLKNGILKFFEQAVSPPSRFPRLFPSKKTKISKISQIPFQRDL